MAQGSQSNMQIDEQAVRRAITIIDQQLSKVLDETKKFKNAIDKANDSMHNNFAPTVSLSQLIEAEEKNFDKVLQAQQDIIDSFKRYNDIAEDANDDRDFRI